METLKDQKCFGGRQLVYAHQSAETATPMEFSLYLPPAAETGPVPLVTYLSGLTCTWANVTEKGGVQRICAELGLALLCPDTSPRGLDLPGEHDTYDFGAGAGFYLDATAEPWSANYRMYSYVTKELYDLARAEFPVRDGPQGIFGHSMGGHGALTIALKNPDKYASVSAFAPIVAPTTAPWGEKAFSGYLGADRETWKEYDACELIAAGKRAEKILVDQGGADEFLEEQLQPQKLVATCKAADIPLTYREHAGYDHSYYFIASFMEDHLRWHAAALTG